MKDSHKEKELKEIDKKILNLLKDFQKRLDEKAEQVQKLNILKIKFEDEAEKINAKINELDTRMQGIRYLEGEAKGWRRYITEYKK